jgi:MYXO-CTERM domain-containing protein
MSSCTIRNFPMNNLFVGRSSFAALVLLLGVALPRPAAASDEFPTELREAAGLDCTPTCTTCHTTDPGQAGTATTSFARAMILEGLVPQRPETVLQAFADIDPDGDGSYVDPDDSTKTIEIDFECQAEVDYGCSVESKPSGSSAWWLPLLLASLGLGVYARRRRQA